MIWLIPGIRFADWPVHFTEPSVDYTVDLCVRQVRRLRELSPLWEMVQEGVDLKSIRWTQH
uniref:Transcriptional regulator n=1 Tax=Macrostomum lignano TaxID=282301 RepID=A0A1I8JPF5_9PLAT